MMENESLKDGENQYKFFSLMHDVHDRLKLLNYEEEFPQLVRLPPIHRYYFMWPVNPGEQFFNFVSHAVWLLNKIETGSNMQMPQESDDPNSLVYSIMENIRKLGAVLDFSPSKLKSGQGSDVVTCLDFLSRKAVEAKRYKYGEMVPDDDVEDEVEQEPEDEQEVDIEKIEEEMDLVYSDSTDDDENESGWVDGAIISQSAQQDNQVQQKIMKSEIDAEQWRMEVERVLPQLKISVKSDGQDWRWRQDQMKVYAEGISKVVDEMSGPLQKLISDERSMNDKLGIREKYLNTQFEPQLLEITKVQEKLSDLKEIHRELSNTVTDKNKILSDITEELEDVRKQLEDRGSIMADGAPVVTTKKALATLKKELADMEVEIGVMEHCVLKSLIQEHFSNREASK